MNTDIDLPLLQLSNVSYDDETITYEGRRLELWNTDIVNLFENLKGAAYIFFQDKMTTIDTDVLKASYDTVDNATMHLSKLLFEYIHKAHILRQNLDMRFDEIKEVVLQDKTTVYEANGTDYTIFDSKELFSRAKAGVIDNIKGDTPEDVVNNIADYQDIIDIKKLAKIIRDEIDDRNIPVDKNLSDLPLIQSVNTVSMSGTEIITNAIDNNDLLNYNAYAETSVGDESEAIQWVESSYGGYSYIFSDSISVNGKESDTLYIFEGS